MQLQKHVNLTLQPNQFLIYPKSFTNSSAKTIKLFFFVFSRFQISINRRRKKIIPIISTSGVFQHSQSFEVTMSTTAHKRVKPCLLRWRKTPSIVEAPHIDIESRNRIRQDRFSLGSDVSLFGKLLQKRNCLSGGLSILILLSFDFIFSPLFFFFPLCGGSRSWM